MGFFRWKRDKYASKGTDIYPHMLILRPHAARYIPNMFKFHERRISSVKFTSAHLYGNVYIRVSVARALVDWSDFGIPCLGRRWIAEQNVTPLALSSAENPYSYKQTRTHKQTVNNIGLSTPWLSAWVDKYNGKWRVTLAYDHFQNVTFTARRSVSTAHAIVVCPSVCLSARPSVCHNCYRIKTAGIRIT